MKAYVLRGFGIECEEEMRRAARSTHIFSSVEDLILPKFFASSTQLPEWPFVKGDWVLLPGGFSYSDHFGSGKLLARRLHEAGFFEALFEKGAHALGVCNGFQMLVESGVFGDQTTLELNNPRGFVNRWVRLKQSFPQNSSLRLPVRHGEGRLCVGPSDRLPDHVERFLSYDDTQVGSSFDNGSYQRTAGLVARKGSSRVWGMMPHPEISLQQQDDPDFFATDFMTQHQESQAHQEGSGLKLLKQIFLCP